MRLFSCKSPLSACTSALCSDKSSDFFVVVVVVAVGGGGDGCGSGSEAAADLPLPSLLLLVFIGDEINFAATKNPLAVAGFAYKFLQINIASAEAQT